MKKRRVGTRRRPRTAQPSKDIQAAAEMRTGLAVTVGWALTLMSTLVAEAIGLLCRWYTILVEPVDLLSVVSVVMLFVAFISGTLTLILIPIVLRFAQPKPPRAVVNVALVAGCVPLLVVAVQFLVRAA